jgi:hypothetical protein
MMYLPIIVMALWVSAFRKFKGNWVLFTTAILLFSIGLLVQYRLYSDPEYNAKNKAAARQEKTETLRMRYVNQNYDAAKRQMMGLPATPPPIEQEAPVKESSYSIGNALTSSYTWIPVFSLVAFGLAFAFCANDKFLSWIQRNSFIVVLLTLIPLGIAIISSSAGKAVGNTTPWEPAKVPFLLGFAGFSRRVTKTWRERTGDSARARHRASDRDGRDSLHSVLRAEGLRPDADLQRRLRHALSRRRARGRSSSFCRLGLSGNFDPRRRRAAARRPGKVSDDSDARATGATCVAARIQQRFHLWLDGFDPPSPETPGGRKITTTRWRKTRA